MSLIRVLLLFFTAFMMLCSGQIWAAQVASSTAKIPAAVSPIVVFGDKNLHPFEFLDGGEPKGANVDLWNAIGRVLNRPVNIKLIDWSDAQKRVLNGEGHALTLMSVTEKRNEIYDFSYPTFPMTFSFFIEARKVKLFNPEKLKGVRIGAIVGGFPLIWLKTNHPDAEIVVAKNSLDGFQQLLNGEINAVALVTWTGYSTLKENGVTSIQAAGPPFAEKIAGIPVPKGNTKLVVDINRAISALKESGEFAAIVDKWSGARIVLIEQKQINNLIWAGVLSLLLLTLFGFFLYLGRIKRAHLEREIHLRTQNELVLTESENRFRRLFEVAPLGYQSLDIDGKFIEVNQAWLDMLGYARDEVIGQDFQSFLVEDGFVDKNLPRFVSEGEIQLPVTVMRCNNGSNKIIHIDGRIGYDEGKNFLQTHCLLTDITERKRSEEALIMGEARLRRAEQFVHMGHWRFSVDDRVLYASDEIYRIYGRDPDTEKLTLRNGTEAFHPDDQSTINNAIVSSIETGNGFDLELRIIRPDGEAREVRVKCECESDEDGEVTALFGVIQDITRQKRVEESLRQAQKMEAIGQLTGGIAHDFNNMLGIIMGNLSLLRRKVADDAKAMEYVEAAYRGGERGASITKKLLGLSRGGNGSRQLIRVNRFIADMENLIARSLTPRISVETQLGDDIWVANIDSGELEDALLNLCLNASDAMPEGGSLVIKTANKFLDERYVQLNPGVAAGEYILISVSDTGTGMPPEVLDQIFQPFFSTKEVGQGTGLGLSMVYGFVQRSGGHIKVYSVPGKGTTFNIYLPRVVEKLVDSQEFNSEVAAALPRGDEMILVVDDEKGLLEVAVAYLEDLGYRTVTASNGGQALAIIRQQNQGDLVSPAEGIDLLFSDVVMPGGMDGYELAREALKANSGLKVLLASGYTAQRKKAASGQVSLPSLATIGLLSKPYNQFELAVALRAALDG